MSSQLYDRLGQGYSEQRRPDPRIFDAVERALFDSHRIVNVGAGTGSYEPRGRFLVAVEPSAEMLRQRPPGSAPAVRALAEHLPFRDGAFDAALAVLTLHHWTDWRKGVLELRRVADRVVILTFDPRGPDFWLTKEYFPEIARWDQERMPAIEDLRQLLGEAEIHCVSIPADCTDGFLGAFWKRPEAYLQPVVRQSISALADVEAADPRLERLAADLNDGTWEARHANLAHLSSLDLGYRLLVAGAGVIRA